MSGSQLPLSSGTLSFAGNNGAVFPIGFGYYPPEGSRAVNLQYAWASSASPTPQSYNEDLSQAVARGIETSIQSVYIDNSSSSNIVTIVVAGTNQVIVCQPGYQGLSPIFFTGTPYYSITCSAPMGIAVIAIGVTRVTFLNVPSQGSAFWPAGIYSGAATFYGNTPNQLLYAQTQGFSLNSYGALYVDSQTPTPTYSASAWFNNVAAATDIFTIYGSNTRTIRITRVSITTAESYLAFFVRRSSVNTGGTSNVITAVPHDSGDNAATATVMNYTANPTGLGTLVGQVDTWNSGTVPNTFTYGINTKPVILHGASQGFCINLNGGGAGGAIGCTFEWTEAY
jgi:hypothetical protein